VAGRVAGQVGARGSEHKNKPEASPARGSFSGGEISGVDSS
jgi:hypothetical protein